jgi:hypothetical protein
MTIELFNQEFEGILGQLKSYLLRITASMQDVEDIIQGHLPKGARQVSNFQRRIFIKNMVVYHCVQSGKRQSEVSEKMDRRCYRYMQTRGFG